MLVDPENPRPDEDVDDVPAPVSIKSARSRRQPIEKNPPGCDICVDGWIGETDDGHPIPCPTCRPAAAQRVARRQTGDQPMSVGTQRHQRVVEDLQRERAAHQETITAAVDLAIALAWSQETKVGWHRALASTNDPAHPTSALAFGALSVLHKTLAPGGIEPVHGCPFCAPYLAADASRTDYERTIADAAH